MKYMGSKNRIAKEILPIMLKERKEGQYWVEPFVGGANLIDKVEGNCIGNDANKYIIALLKEMKKENFEVDLVTECEFNTVKHNKEHYPDWYIGYVGYQLSYGAQFFSSYRKDSVGKRNYDEEAKRNLEKQAKNIKHILFYNECYKDLIIPKDSIIYCDPPYKNTSGYKNVEEFNHDVFWEWAREKVKEGHTVFVSEYTAPEDWICIWQKEIVSSLTKDTGSKKGIEKLFKHKSQL